MGNSIVPQPSVSNSSWPPPLTSPPFTTGSITIQPVCLNTGLSLASSNDHLLPKNEEEKTVCEEDQIYGAPFTTSRNVENQQILKCEDIEQQGLIGGKLV